MSAQFEQILINRAGDYREMGRDYRKQELYDAACTCEDTAWGLHVALRLYRKFVAAPPDEQMGQKE